jgi:hypothetical protein
VALTMLRIIKYKITKYQAENPQPSPGLSSGKTNAQGNGKWESEFTDQRIQKALNSWTTSKYSEGIYYRMGEYSEDLIRIFEVFGFSSELDLLSASQLRQLKLLADKVVSNYD